MDYFNYMTKVTKSDEEQEMHGYTPSDRESEKDDAPLEYSYSENVFGNIAAGKNKKDEKVFIVSQRRQLDGMSSSPEEKSFKEQTKAPLPKRQANMFVNSEDKRESALEYRNLRDKSSAFIVNTLIKSFEKNDLDIQQGVLPFTDVKQGRRELERLHMQRQLSDQKDETLEKAIEESSSELVQKEQHMNRFKKQMEEMVKDLDEKKVPDITAKKLMLVIAEGLSDGDDDEKNKNEEKDNSAASQDDGVGEKKIKEKSGEGAKTGNAGESEKHDSDS